ncbi:MAG TPA: hypothetical protein VHM19_04075 [Polyangiales bacterium]|nr:hypothetical protein [Polyangiales bacterium]
MDARDSTGMTKGAISASVEALLGRIDSFEQLDVLVYLGRTAPALATIDAVCAATKLSRESSASSLQALCAAGLVQCTGEGASAVFSCRQDAEHGVTLRQLVTAYDNFLPELVMLMSEKSIERVRTAVLRRFSDAFLVGGKKKDG